MKPENAGEEARGSPLPEGVTVANLRGPDRKCVGKPDAGNRHVRFDEQGSETGLLAPRPSSTLPTVDENKEVIAQPSEPAVLHDDSENENSEQPPNPRKDAALTNPSSALNQRVL
jgi:hypothetical protein